MGKKKRTRALLFDELEKRLLAYTLAGAGMVALRPAAHAEIVYTPKDFRLQGCGAYQIDLNNDGLSDFDISIVDIGTYYANSVMEVRGNGLPGAGIIGLNSRGAGALRAKFPIGPTSPTSFINVDSQPLLMESMNWSGRQYGLWLRVDRRYLGLRFNINGETHYGWARLSVGMKFGPKCFRCVGRITGYAYETQPDTMIRAGNTGLDSEATTGAGNFDDVTVDNSPERSLSLGLLSLGSTSIDALHQDKKAVAIKSK